MPVKKTVCDRFNEFMLEVESQGGLIEWAKVNQVKAAQYALVTIFVLIFLFALF